MFGDVFSIWLKVCWYVIVVVFVCFFAVAAGACLSFAFFVFNFDVVFIDVLCILCVFVLVSSIV